VKRYIYAFDSTDSARATVTALRARGIDEKCISLIARADIQLEKIPDRYLDASTDFMPALGRGAALGGIAGMFAGIVAMADQLAGRRLGNINSALYSLRYGTDGLVDVTSGNNSATFTDSTGTHTVVGYPALPGYDLVTGLGTVDAARFVPALVRASGDDDRGGADG